MEEGHQTERMIELDIWIMVSGPERHNVPKRILNVESLDYQYKSRPGLVEMPLDQLEREQGGVRAKKKAGQVLPEVAGLWKENEGPFFLGKTTSYADLVQYHSKSVIHLHKARIKPGGSEHTKKRRREN